MAKGRETTVVVSNGAHTHPDRYYLRLEPGDQPDPAGTAADYDFLNYQQRSFLRLWTPF